MTWPSYLSSGLMKPYEKYLRESANQVLTGLRTFGSCSVAILLGLDDLGDK